MKKLFLSIFFLYTIVFMLTGCGDRTDSRTESDSPVHAVFVLGSTANTPVLNIPAAADLISRVCAQGGSTVSFLVADGQPYLFDEITAPEVDSSYSKTKQKQIIEARVAEMTSIVSEALAREPHADYLGAIEMAGRILQSFDDDYEKELVIFGSCLSDVEPLDFSKMYLDNIDTEQVMDTLRATDNIAKLEGCSVTVYNCGDVAAPQKTLSPAERKVLQQIWESILEAGGPETLIFATDLPTQLVYEGLPEVNTVPVVVESAALKEKEADAEPVRAPEADAVVFDETVIRFEPGAATLVDPQAAMEAIHEVRQFMEDHPEKKALLVGCTARWGNEEDSLSLSFDRAAAIRSLFTDAGIRKDRLTILGTGWMSPFYKNDQAKDGGLDESIAPGNRSTVWIDAESGLAELVLNSNYADKFLTE